MSEVKPKIYLKRVVNSYMTQAAERTDPKALGERLASLETELDGFAGGAEDFSDLSHRLSALASEIAVSATRKKEAYALLESATNLEAKMETAGKKVAAEAAASAQKDVSNDIKVAVAGLVRTFRKHDVDARVAYDIENDTPVAKIILGTVRQPCPELVFRDTAGVNLVVGGYDTHLKLGSSDPFADLRKALMMRGYRV